MATLSEMLNAEQSVVIAGHEIKYRILTIVDVLNAVQKGIRDQALAVGEVPPKGVELQREAERRLSSEDFPCGSMITMIYKATKGLNKGLIEKIKDVEALLTTETMDEGLKLGMLVATGDAKENNETSEAGDNGRAEGKEVVAASGS